MLPMGAAKGEMGTRSKGEGEGDRLDIRGLRGREERLKMALPFL